MEEKDQIELVQWLIGRSDAMRASYSSRAALILSADAIILAAIVFLLDKNLGQSAGILRISITVFALASLVLMLISLIHAFNASISRKSSSEATNYQGPGRVFLNPGDTFTPESERDNPEKFISEFQSLSSKEFIKGACGELWVDLKLQRSRYVKLKKAARFIVGSFLSLVIALLLMLLR
jgi:hypothetical protein